jgi:hypothetical protein
MLTVLVTLDSFMFTYDGRNDTMVGKGDGYSQCRMMQELYNQNRYTDGKLLFS